MGEITKLVSFTGKANLETSLLNRSFDLSKLKERLSYAHTNSN
jgi:hypothetical protein